MYLIKKVSEISGVSVRTLHHYDKIGLLSPRRIDNGYRYYNEEDLSLLQTILYYKYLGFSLAQVKEILDKTESDQLVHLRRQLTLMQAEKERLLTLINTLEKTIKSIERKMNMSTKEKFMGFTPQDNQKYKRAAIEKYGAAVIEQAGQKQRGKEQLVADGFNKIFFAFSDNLSNGLAATAKENIDLAAALHRHLCQYAFDCSTEVFSKIGFGYVQNDEFKQNIDKFGAGTAQYVCDAIQKYAAQSIAARD